jgi:hypothetical protein
MVVIKGRMEMLNGKALMSVFAYDWLDADGPRRDSSAQMSS